MSEEKAQQENFLNRIITKLYPLGLKDEMMIHFKNSVPLALSILSQQLLSMMCFFFCGHVGPNELAAVSLANTLIHIGSFGPILGLASASETLFPQLYGGKDKKKVGIIVQRGVLISLMASFFCIGFLLNSKYIMKFFVKDEYVVMLADTFIVYFSPSILFYSIQIIISKYLQSQNIFYPVLFINVLVNILNACLQWVLVIWTEMGVIGSAISVVIVNIIQLALLIIYIVKKKIHEETWPGWSIECFYDWKLYLKLGMAGFGMVVFEWASFEIAVMSSGLLGNTELSVMSITQQTALTFILFAFGIASSGNIRVGQLLGENSPEKALNSTKVVYTITLLCGTSLALIMIIFSDYVPYIFTNNSELVSQVSKPLKFLGVIHVFDELQVCGGGILRALGSQTFGVIIAFIAFYLISLPIGLYLLLNTSLTVTGFWIGFSCAAFFLLLCQVVFIFRVNWEEKAKMASELALRMKKDKVKVNNVEVSSIENNPNPEKVQNLKRKIFKKILVLASVLSIFLVSILTRNLSHFSVELDKNSTNSTDN
ncbi:unnamed protein product [Brachionus calyciflorus]|uniref:Multidrug and toxin extrusion protein n=1 Tax=Brachionus calyciflorus TaxID=104777 RepID=A0A813YFJ3_9BILA|nr:unnamed protein product [Brachionus calyciflorus]